MKTRRLDEMLSAYLDNELSRADHSVIERKIGRAVRMLRLLGDFRRLRKRLRKLPKAPAPGDIAEDTVDRLREETAELPVGPPIVVADAAVEPSDFVLQLQAYVDQELSEDELRQVEERLLADADNRAALEELRELVMLVQEMPSLAVPKGFQRAFLKRLRKETRYNRSGRAGRAFGEDGSRRRVAKPRKRPFSELLSAYLDGEISPQRRRRVAQKLSGCNVSRRVLRHFRKVSHAVAGLEPVAAPSLVVENVLAQLRVEQMEAQPAAPVETVESVTNVRTPRRGWQLIAILLPVAMFVAGLAVGLVWR